MEVCPDLHKSTEGNTNPGKVYSIHSLVSTPNKVENLVCFKPTCCITQIHSSLAILHIPKAHHNDRGKTAGEGQRQLKTKCGEQKA